MGKKNKDSLGRSLIKDRISKNRHKKLVNDNSMLHTTELKDGRDYGRLNLQSVTEESSLQEFLTLAELAQLDFSADRTYSLYHPFETSIPEDTSHTQPNFEEPLTVPRRPLWTPGVTSEEQLNKERESFLEWRKHLNGLRVKLGDTITPYEKNIEFWRQLWRTLEKADLVLILLDARNPLIFRCVDLEKYASEQKCTFLLLLNKADLISEYARKCWAEYFYKEKVQIIFFSAAKNSKERKISESSNEPSEHDVSDSDSESAHSDCSDAIEKEALKCTEDDIESFKKQLGDIDNAVSNTADKLDRIQVALDKVVDNLRKGKPVEVDNSLYKTYERIENSHEIFDRDRLLEYLKSQKRNLKTLKHPPRISVGIIGYPNVGKSSTVNFLMQTKKVSVSTMPGHTRHVQSLILDDDLELLDCPGLVLPAYAVKPDLLITAVLSIDQMRSHEAAMARLCQLVSKRTFEEKYGLLLPESDDKVASYTQILTAHAYNRGFMTAAGQPDQSRSARLLLKDAASGRLHWEQLPPGYESPPEEKTVEENRTEKRKPTPREARVVEGWSNKAAEIDSAFFASSRSTAHVKGKPIIGIHREQRASDQTGKPWKLEKKHANKNKREKLRRVYAHLDEH